MLFLEAMSIGIPVVSSNAWRAFTIDLCMVKMDYVCQYLKNKEFAEFN